MNNKKKEIEAYKTIGEVADELELPQHVIRFWETKFSVLRPKKINTRRYFSRPQLEILHKIKELLYGKGFTIAGAISFLKQEKSSKVTVKALSNSLSNPLNLNSNYKLVEIRNKLQNLQTKLLSVADSKQ